MSRAPAFFISHGSPATALDDSAFTRGLARFGQGLTSARAFLVVSAHWRARHALVGAAPAPEVIYDFGGFSRELYTLKYGAPGDPALAAKVEQRLAAAGIATGLDPTRGFDHGVWVPLRFVAPAAEIPVVPLALPTRATPQELIDLGAALAPLRDEGIVLVGSGAMTHNLGAVLFDDKEAAPPAWASEFDGWAAAAAESRDLAALAAFREQAPHARQAHPTWEHFAPLLVVAGASRADDRVETVTQGFEYGTLSMRSLAYA